MLSLSLTRSHIVVLLAVVAILEVWSSFELVVGVVVSSKTSADSSSFASNSSNLSRVAGYGTTVTR